MSPLSHDTCMLHVLGPPQSCMLSGTPPSLPPSLPPCLPALTTNTVYTATMHLKVEHSIPTQGAWGTRYPHATTLSRKNPIIRGFQPGSGQCHTLTTHMSQHYSSSNGPQQCCPLLSQNLLAPPELTIVPLCENWPLENSVLLRGPYAL